MLRFETIIGGVFLSVCGADESSPRRAGRTGGHGLQVGSDGGEEKILLPGGQTVLRHQTAHKLPLQGDRQHLLYITGFFSVIAYSVFK